MSKSAATYTDRAVAAFEAGFATKSARQAALTDLNSAYGCLREVVMDACLQVAFAADAKGEARPAAEHNLYWAMPNDLHQYRAAKHTAQITAVFPQLAEVAAQIEGLVDLREAIKASEIIAAERPAADKREQEIMVKVRDILAARKASYAKGLELHDVFGYLPVSINTHMVTNQFGHTFLRNFYFMDGKLTALQVILAVMDTKAREAEGQA